ncbi:MAG TPA: mechanosensitive ion channel domain-containing protein [Edaphobacter sp.]|nr:mechanosensitive ion channel domain-containing protein [Edaphobacter sp.]
MLFLAPDLQEEHLSKILVQDWHNYIVEFVGKTLPRLVVILLIAFIAQRIVKFFVNRMRSRADRQVGNSQRAAQLRTMAAIVRATSYSIIGFLAFLYILYTFGINPMPMLAGAGVLGVGIGLGAQSIFKDMLNGIFILVEDQYNVGEVVKIAGLQGTVEDLSLRVTTLRDGDGTLYTIPNSQIATVSNLSRDFSLATLNVNVDASANPDKVMAVLQTIAIGVRKDPAFKDIAIADPNILGVDKIDGNAVTYPVQIRVRANQRDPVLRELRRRIILTFEKEGIPLGISSSMLVLQQKTDPTAPPAAPAISA